MNSWLQNDSAADCSNPPPIDSQVQQGFPECKSCRSFGNGQLDSSPVRGGQRAIDVGLLNRLLAPDEPLCANSRDETIRMRWRRAFMHCQCRAILRIPTNGTGCTRNRAVTPQAALSTVRIVPKQPNVRPFSGRNRLFEMR